MSDKKRVLLIEYQEASEEVFNELEAKGLVKRFLNRDSFSVNDPERFSVSDIYRTDDALGGHKLIKVCFNMTEPVLGWHEDNEDFILIKDPDIVYKDLYLVVALGKDNEINSKIESGELCSNDIMVIKIKYNDPFLSFFTMFGHVPHCELTVEAGKAPVFFVTEPSRLGNIELNMKNYQIKAVLDATQAGRQ